MLKDYKILVATEVLDTENLCQFEVKELKPILVQEEVRKGKRFHQVRRQYNMATQTRSNKKKKKINSNGVVHIKATFNNTR